MKKFELTYKEPYWYSPGQPTQDEELHVIETALIQVSLDTVETAMKKGETWINCIQVLRGDDAIIIHRYYGPDEEDGYLEACIAQENFIEIKKAWHDLKKQRVPGITIKEENGWFSVEANYDLPPVHERCKFLGELKEW